MVKLSRRAGVFADYRVGTLTVPGGLALLRPPTPMAIHRDTHWGAIRPPDVAAMAKDNVLPVNAEAAGAAGPPAPQLATQPPAPARQDDRALSAAAVAAIIVGLAGIGGALVAGRHWILRGGPRPATSRPGPGIGRQGRGGTNVRP